MITDSDISLCWEFAHKQLETSRDCYEARGLAPSRLHSQIMQGKLAEIFVSRYLALHGRFTSTPDFDIHQKHFKSYDADLKLREHDLHVKSCHIDIAKKVGWGWVFQKNDPLVTRPNNNDWIVLVKVYPSNKMEIASIINGLDAIYKPPKYNLPSKCVIYERDII